MVEQLCHILLDKVSIDDVITLFYSHKLFTDDDLKVISFTPSEYLKRQFLLRSLRYLKLTFWLIICDIMDEHVGSQLRDGKLCIVMYIIFVDLRTCMHVCGMQLQYVCMYVHMSMLLCAYVCIMYI